jgi:mannose/fructose-specific phosphotransferase system component IIA
MKGILLVSHGGLAEGMRESLELFSGKLEQLAALSLSAGQDISEFNEQLVQKIASVDSGDGVVVFCVLAVGTPANVVARLLTAPKYKGKLQIVTGMNLPMVLEYSQLRAETIDFNDMIKVGKDGIINLNESLNL